MMDNLALSDNSLFAFDFRNDFTDGEQRVMDEILINLEESANFYEGDTEFDANRTSSSSLLDYLCNDSGSTADVTTLEHLSNNQLMPFGRDLNQVGHENNAFVTEQENFNAVSVDQEANFDWTTFLDKSPAQTNIVEEISTSLSDYASNSTVVDPAIRYNGRVYEELKTLDVPQMYANLDQTFDLKNLKKIDESMNYSSLPIDQRCHEDWNILNNNAPQMNQKMFLLPMQLNESGIKSLQQVDKKLKNDPHALNFLAQQCDKDSRMKVYLPQRPCQTERKSEKYLTVNEQLEQVQTKEIILPSIEQKNQRKKRKEAPKIDKEKVSISYAFEVVLSNIAKSFGEIQPNKRVNTKKATRSRKSNAKQTKHTTNETVDETKSSRTTSKKFKPY